MVFLMLTTTNSAANLPRVIQSLSDLNASAPTPISEDTNVLVPGCYLDWDGGKVGTATAKGARYTLRAIGTDARLRDLVIA